MARRNTIQEAEALKSRWQGQHPGLTFVIDSFTKETETTLSRAEAQGFDIIRRINDDTVLVSIEWHEIHELVKCQGCGREWRNNDIGNVRTDVCSKCETPGKTDEQIRAEADRWLAESQARENWNQ